MRLLHDRGIKVESETLGKWDQPPLWKQALAAGTDYVQTDLPEEFLACDLFERIEKRPVRFALHRRRSRYAPENTAPAFNKAFKLNADYVEFDVRTTQDRALYLLHDASLNRTTNGQGPISRSTAEDLRRLDAGSWFSREYAGTRLLALDDFLELAKEQTLLYFDAKALAPNALADAFGAARPG